MNDFRFPKIRRLTRQYEFKRLYRTGLKRTNRFLSVYTSPVEGRRGKVGIVASRRVGKAVERNRIRRVLRETFRTNQDKISDTVDVVIVVKPDALELPHRELAGQLLQLLGKSEALNA